MTGYNDKLQTHVFGEVTFLRLAPGAHLRAHVGGHNTRLTVHLGLIVPEGPIIYVGDTPARCVAPRAAEVRGPLARVAEPCFMPRSPLFPSGHGRRARRSSLTTRSSTRSGTWAQSRATSSTAACGTPRCFERAPTKVTHTLQCSHNVAKKPPPSHRHRTAWHRLPRSHVQDVAPLSEAL